jgi:hypothetical protein
MSRLTRRTKTILLLLAMILITIGYFSTARSASMPAAPRFVVTDLGGTEIELADLISRGPVLLDFWATWCKPCAASLPELEARHFLSGTVSAPLSDRHEIVLFAGQRRGGRACTAGTCYDVLSFKGVELRLTSRL